MMDKTENTTQASLYEMVLMQYAAGTIDESHRLIVESHMALNPSCAPLIHDYEAFGGHMLGHLGANTTMSDGALTNVLSMIDAPDSQPHSSQPIDTACPIYPESLVAFCGWTAQSTPWKKMLPGVSSATPKGQMAQLLKVEPGVAMPEHDHKDLELTLLLDGAYHDETGYYKRGDLVVMDRDMEHQPIADKVTGCICLVVNDAPLRFTGLFGPILNLLSR